MRTDKKVCANSCLGLPLIRVTSDARERPAKMLEAKYHTQAVSCQHEDFRPLAIGQIGYGA